MGHRHIYSSSRLSDMENERSWSQPQPDLRLHLENEVFMLPVENPAVGVNNSSLFNVPPRSDNFPFSNFSLEALNYDAATIGTYHGPYMNFSAGNSSQVPSHYVHHGQPCYNQFSVGSTSRTINPQADYGRVPFKRKRPTLYMPYDNGSSNGYNAGSPSNIRAYSDHLQANPVTGSPCWVRGSTNIASSFGNNLFLAGEGSQRNIRSRHSHVEFNPSGVHACRNLSHSNPVVAGEWDHTCIPLESHRTFSSGSSLSSSSIESTGAYHSNQTANRNQNTPFPIHGHPIRGTGLGHNGHIHRTSSYRPTPSYRSMGFTTASEISRRPVVEAVAPFRYPRPVSLGGHSGNRIGRGTFYGSPNLFDQHHDMRLDIDSMGYEELLALEERIGNVSTGLSENKISKYLKEVIYYSDQTLDEDGGNCIICLEEYKEWDRLGGLRCGHDFHYSCIEKWLQIKNVCPICKASVAKDIEK